MSLSNITLHKKKIFPLRVSSANVTKPLVTADLVTFTGEIFNAKLPFFAKIATSLYPLSIFANKFHHKYLRGF